MARNPVLERDEDFREDCRQAGKEDIHPRLRANCSWRTQRCRACGQRFMIEALTEDVLCSECDRAVRELEKGRIS